jgi:hypothetical protein
MDFPSAHVMKSEMPERLLGVMKKATHADSARSDERQRHGGAAA